MSQPDQNKNHIPVLLAPVLLYLQSNEGQSYLDLTAGYGGHAAAVLERTFRPDKAVLVDRDQEVIKHLGERYPDGPRIIHQDFLAASRNLMAEGQTFDMILADLGVSSPHLDSAGRGFSHRSEGPLDMRMDQSQELTADFLVNNWEAGELEDIIRRYGEEPRARAIARSIVAQRPVKTTTQLADIVARAWPGHSRIHPATRTFQALRIAVNDELRQLADSLPFWMSLLAPEGRLVIISFHSLEDRIVKQFFAEHSGGYDAELRLLTRRPVLASNTELVYNPRARSAKLRAAVKINTKTKI